MEKKKKGVGITGRKSYLSEQINLMSFSTTDLFTDEEYELYGKILKTIADLNEDEQIRKKEKARDPTIREQLVSQKKNLQAELDALIASRTEPRVIRLSAVLNKKRLSHDENHQIVYPPGITWDTLNVSRRIAEFSSEESRGLGLKANDVTFDKIIVKWKSLDILKQIVLNGFCVPILHNDGTVETKHYRFATASAGQLRTDKIQMLSDDAWNKLYGRLFCGLTFEEINEKGGINVNKLMAYIALASSATEEWTEFDIDRAIVIDDFEAPVTGLVDFISSDYQMTRCVKTTTIKHTDGIGMMLPCVSRRNFMVRAPWIKGLLTSFDFIRFCKETGAKPILKDIWGNYHDLVKENIQIIFTKSQFKLANFYNDWNDYKTRFKANGCHCNRTNFEESYFPDKEISYQMLQTLVDFTDEEIKLFCSRSYEKIKNIASSTNAMLTTLKADEDSPNPYKRALAIYPELLREAYSRETLKAIKKRWTLDAKSGRIICDNKRLYLIPDMYAACEYWFLHIKEPKGLLENGWVSCKPFRNKDKIDVLRSPHLSMEHVIEKVVKNQTIYDWFYTDGIYTSCHDLISKVLQ